MRSDLHIQHLDALFVFRGFFRADLYQKRLDLRKHIVIALGQLSDLVASGRDLDLLKNALRDVLHALAQPSERLDDKRINCKVPGDENHQVEYREAPG